MCFPCCAGRGVSSGPAPSVLSLSGHLRVDPGLFVPWDAHSWAAAASAWLGLTSSSILAFPPASGLPGSAGSCPQHTLAFHEGLQNGDLRIPLLLLRLLAGDPLERAFSRELLGWVRKFPRILGTARKTLPCDFFQTCLFQPPYLHLQTARGKTWGSSFLHSVRICNCAGTFSKDVPRFLDL